MEMVLLESAVQEEQVANASIQIHSCLPSLEVVMTKVIRSTKLTAHVHPLITPGILPVIMLVCMEKRSAMNACLQTHTTAMALAIAQVLPVPRAPIRPTSTVTDPGNVSTQTSGVTSTLSVAMERTRKIVSRYIERKP